MTDRSGRDTTPTERPPAPDTEAQLLRRKASELRLQATELLRDAAGFEAAAGRLVNPR